MAPLIMCLVFSAAFSPEAITLVERSVGLETPEKGSGRTEYEIGDINADGSMDFICTRWGSGIYTSVFFGNGQFDFTMNQDSMPGSVVNAVDTGDFNNDGEDDILVSFASDSGARVYSFNTSTESWEDCSSGLPGGSSYSMVQFGHLNGDEYLDVIVYSKPQGTVYLGDGQGNWTPDAVFSFSTPGNDSALRSGGDIDHDGRHDLVVQAAEGTIYTYTNTLRALSPWQQPAELTARLVSPRGGETFPAGSVRFISWLTAVPPAANQARVKIELSQTGPSGPWVTIAEAAPDNGRFQWTVSQVNSSQCRLRITATAGAQTYQHMSPESFTIVQLTGAAENHAAAVPSLNLLVHPNPSSGAVTLTVPGEEVFPGEITIMDITGRTVEKLTVGSCPAVIGESLPPGIYTVLLECSGGTAGARFVKL